VQIDDELAAFLECTGSLIVATVDAAGVPTASRAWDLQVVGDRARVRVQLDAADRTALESVGAGRSVAVTVTDVFTLRSVQVKGTGTAASAPTADDTVHGERYRAGFLANVAEIEQVPAALPERLIPTSFRSFEMAIDEVFDQTPGPAAGAPLGASP
jgi:hypothetical protein